MPIFAGWYQPKKERVKGWIYVIKSNDGLYKIGHTNNVKRRFDQHRYKNPGSTLEIVLTIETIDRYKTETKIFHALAHKRVYGEWFELTEHELNYLRNWQD